MELTITKSIKKNKYSVEIAFSKLGSTTLTPEKEAELIESYAPEFNYGDITFTGKYKVEQGKIVKDDANGTDVKIAISNRTVKIDENLLCSYRLSIDEILTSEKTGTLNTMDLVAKAKVQLFIDKITDKIKTVLGAYATALDDWETVETVVV